ncbi:MAG: HAD hydrolase family protein [Candidatus Moeniiplasma glomeromycotorum]|nr:HAD hydrolase family protein [Candidatus Moeniiplasma glomeromycotorum]MCE8168294.1 HAD hydrolase family protein [Candidatus Moeniiplasma glomeromycotorum]MCE8169841.1 HAD hydrolase family protein [Candidatus Moeniiplasma glomeromycotorum]
MNIPVINREIHLIKLDIDGTSTNADFSTLNQNLKIVLQKLKERGHKICFTTGRNYLSALPFYKEVGLDTFLVTYNGAYINNPSDEDNKEIVAFHSIKNKIVKDILSEPVIKENICNVLIDHVNGLKTDGEIDLKTVSTSDDIYYQEIFFNGNPYTKGENIFQLLGKKDVLQLVLEFPKNEKIFNEILLILRRKYNEVVSFYFGSKLKAKSPGDKILVLDPERKIIKIRNKLASKGMGAKWVATQYNINMHNVIAFGNDVNDIELVHSVGKGVVTADSDNYLKTYAYGITDFGLLNSDGVAKYLTDYFGLES